MPSDYPFVLFLLIESMRRELCDMCEDFQLRCEDSQLKLDFSQCENFSFLSLVRFQPVKNK